MKNYKVQDGCWNCMFKLDDVVYPEEKRIYCINDGTKRPASFIPVVPTNFFMGENIFKSNIAQKLEWEEKHRIDAHGICDNHRMETKDA